MAHCHEMKKGQVYACGDCGMEIEIVEECTCETDASECGCSTGQDNCVFKCCGEDLTLKA